MKRGNTPPIKHMEVKPMYCVTAVSKLTGKRERVSIISPKRDVVEALYLQYQAHKYRRKPYIRPKVEVYQPDMFNNK